LELKLAQMIARWRNLSVKGRRRLRPLPRSRFDSAFFEPALFENLLSADENTIDE
jgi:hypothetical protein